MRRKPPLVTALSVALSSVLCLALPNGGLAQQAADRASQPVVVELFTSQGCSSCPPADALLAELIEQPDIIALSMHVDYWDYLGWRDRYASPAMTQRQRDYQAAHGARSIYTPQMIVQGREAVIGHRRADVAAAIAAQRAVPPAVDIRLMQTDGQVMVEIVPIGAPTRGVVHMNNKEATRAKNNKEKKKLKKKEKE